LIDLVCRVLIDYLIMRLSSGQADVVVKWQMSEDPSDADSDK